MDKAKKQNSPAPVSANPLLTVVCLGALVGCCAPLIAVPNSSDLLPRLFFTLPLGVAAIYVVWRLLILKLSGFIAASQVKNRALYILMPLGILAFAPLVRIFPVYALPQWLAFIALSVCAYRFVLVLKKKESVTHLEQRIFFTIFLIGLVIFFQVTIVHDAFQYYGYLVSIFIDHDLNLYNQIYLHNTYRSYNPFPLSSARYIGTAVMEAPAMVLGHLSALLFNALGQSHPLTGYSFPYLFWVCLTSSLFGLAGLILCYFLAKEFFDREISLLAVVGIWLGSPLLFFMFSWNGWPHLFSFFFISAFLLYWRRTGKQRTLKQWAMLGVIGGLLILIRPTDGMVFIFPLVEVMASCLQRSRINLSERLFPIAGAALFLLMAILIFTPQLSIWKAISGFWTAAPYSEVGDYFDWRHPQWLGVLFSPPRHGLFVWSPLLLLAAIGLVFLWSRSRFFTIMSAVIVLGTIYLYACWSIWWSGVGFSNRFFIILTPFFILGLAGLINYVRRWLTLEFLWGLISLAVAANIYLIGEYRANIVPYSIPDPYRVVDEPLSLGKMLYNHLAVFPLHWDSLFWSQWSNENLFSNRLLHALFFHNPLEFLSVGLMLLIAGLLGWMLIKLLFHPSARLIVERLKSWPPILAILLVIVLHGIIWTAKGNTRPTKDFYYFEQSGFLVSPQAKESYLYCTYPQPITTLDILSFLINGSKIPQNAEVAEIEVYDEAGRKFVKSLRAGIDTAETSYLRPENAEGVKHGYKQLKVVRQEPTSGYSHYIYNNITSHSVMELPEPIRVNKIVYRYLYPEGSLLVVDTFLRNF